MKYLFFKLHLLVCLFSITSISYSQERTLTGFVTTLESIVVVNAQVKVLSSKATVLTDSVGKFEVSCLRHDKIKVSAKGFKSQKVKIDEKTKEVFINLTFNPTEKNIERAVGYGYIKDEDQTYAISSTRNNGKNDFTMYTNMIDVIVNISPSVVYRNGGFVIRGAGSLLSSNNALIVIDGNAVNISQLNALPPLAVKSVDILKGAASAIYGSRGANGVIVIITKKE
jgi:TonB-dependent SusC/RagA subfamily outer membrane receptor